MNEPFIFFKIRFVFKKKGIETEALFTNTEMNNELNVNFIQNTMCAKNIIESGVVFRKTEINNEWNVHFLHNTMWV